jgi:hypothetical protein
VLPALPGMPLALVLPALPGMPLALVLPALPGMPLPLALVLPALPGLPPVFPADRAPLLTAFLPKQFKQNFERLVCTLRPHLLLQCGNRSAPVLAGRFTAHKFPKHLKPKWLRDMQITNPTVSVQFSSVVHYVWKMIYETHTYI